jgi:hypothetical protein
LARAAGATTLPLVLACPPNPTALAGLSGPGPLPLPEVDAAAEAAEAATLAVTGAASGEPSALPLGLVGVPAPGCVPRPPGVLLLLVVLLVVLLPDVLLATSPPRKSDTRPKRWSPAAGMSMGMV